MSQFILIDRIKVQNANAVAGFTWGFPAITNFLGFVHNLSRKLCNKKKCMDISLKGCVVVVHEHIGQKKMATGLSRLVIHHICMALKLGRKVKRLRLLKKGK